MLRGMMATARAGSQRQRPRQAIRRPARAEVLGKKLREDIASAAPRAVRMATSLWRVVPLASRRFATLTQAIAARSLQLRGESKAFECSLRKEVILQRFNIHAPTLVALWKRFCDIGSDRIHVGLCLLHGDAIFKPAHRQQPMKIMVQLFGLENKRNNQPLIKAVRLARRQHADNGIGVPSM